MRSLPPLPSVREKEEIKVGACVRNRPLEILAAVSELKFPKIVSGGASQPRFGSGSAGLQPPPPSPPHPENLEVISDK